MQGKDRAFQHSAATAPGAEILKSIRHIDHITYVARHEDEKGFLERWRIFGFSELVRLRTRRFPATHIALVSGVTQDFPWATMTGLSVSEDHDSPVNHFLRRYGEGVQHVAYNINPDADMPALQKELKRLGWTFMTPVLSYQDKAGAHLRQMFSAPTAAYGTFIELVQRLPSPSGEIYDGFDVQNIDDLYQSYTEYSVWLDRKAMTHMRSRLNPLEQPLPIKIPELYPKDLKSYGKH